MLHRDGDREGSAEDKTPPTAFRGLLLETSSSISCRFACNLRHTLADNFVCLELTLGEPVDFVFNFV